MPNVMKRVKTRGTAPERAVRRELRKVGLRYRLNVAELPGHPDIYIPCLRTAVFVHGCFWHAHTCSRGKAPRTNTAFWGVKLAGNAERDRRTARVLETMGIRVVTIWGCQLSGVADIAAALHRESLARKKDRETRSQV